MRVIGLCIAVVVGLVMTINAALMLATPRSSYRLPGWLRAQGSLIEDRSASGWGAIQVRLAGGVILAAIAWVLYDMLLKR